MSVMDLVEARRVVNSPSICCLYVLMLLSILCILLCFCHNSAMCESMAVDTCVVTWSAMRGRTMLVTSVTTLSSLLIMALLMASSSLAMISSNQVLLCSLISWNRVLIASMMMMASNLSSN